LKLTEEDVLAHGVRVTLWFGPRSDRLLVGALARCRPYARAKLARLLIEEGWRARTQGAPIPARREPTGRHVAPSPNDVNEDFLTDIEQLAGKAVR